MKLKDLLALAKQGYSLSDIKELEALAEADEPEKEENEPGSEEPNEPDDGGEEVPDEPEVDYKKLYEKSLDDLKKAQEANRKHNVGEVQKSDQDVLDELIRGWN